MTSDEFKKIRNQKKLSQKALGEKIGYKNRRIIMFENGSAKIPLSLSLAMEMLATMDPN